MYPQTFIDAAINIETGVSSTPAFTIGQIDSRLFDEEYNALYHFIDDFDTFTLDIEQPERKQIRILFLCLIASILEIDGELPS